MLPSYHPLQMKSLTRSSAGMYAYEANLAWGQVDQVLADAANHAPLDAFQPGSGQPPGGPGPGHGPGGPYRPQSPDVFTLVLAAPHSVIGDWDQVAQFDLPDWTSAGPVLAGQQPQAYATIQRGSYRLRLYTLPVREDGRIVGAVQAGTSLVQLDRQLQDLLHVLALLGGGVLLLTGISSVYLTERALAPARVAYVRQRQFTAGASHELRTPLAFIRSQAALIAGAGADPSAARAGAGRAGVAGPRERSEELAQSERSGPGPEAETGEVPSDAREIIAEVDYMSRLVGDLLVLARDEHDRAPAAWSGVDLAALAEEVAAKVGPLARARDLTLAVQPRGAPDHAGRVVVRGDADRLRQLILILLDNAVRYTPAGGVVRIGVQAVRRPHLGWDHGGQAQLTVSDTGAGIAPEHLPHIFEPFYRVAVSRGQRGAEGSTGLGLALAQWIVQAHDGSITVRSTPGAGSVFTATLPLAADQRGGA